MNKEKAKEIVQRCFTPAVKEAFCTAILDGFKKYNRIKENEDYSSLKGYEKNSRSRLLYSSICSCLDDDKIRKLGFVAKMEVNTSSYKVHIYNDDFVIDVFNEEHKNTTRYQEKRFLLNKDDEGQKYIIITYYGEKGVLHRIMVYFYSETRNLIYDDKLWCNEQK